MWACVSLTHTSPAACCKNNLLYWNLSLKRKKQIYNELVVIASRQCFLLDSVWWAVGLPGLSTLQQWHAKKQRRWWNPEHPGQVRQPSCQLLTPKPWSWWQELVLLVWCFFPYLFELQARRWRAKLDAFLISCPASWMPRFGRKPGNLHYSQSLGIERQPGSYPGKVSCRLGRGFMKRHLHVTHCDRLKWLTCWAYLCTSEKIDLRCAKRETK